MILDPDVRAELQSKYPDLGDIPEPSDKAQYDAYRMLLKDRSPLDAAKLGRIKGEDEIAAAAGVKDNVGKAGQSAEQRDRRRDKLLAGYTQTDRTGKRILSKNAIMGITAAVAIPLIGLALLGTGKKPAPTVEEQTAAEQTAVTTPTGDVAAITSGGDVPPPPPGMGADTTPAGGINGAGGAGGTDTGSATPNATAPSISLENGAENVPQPGASQQSTYAPQSVPTVRIPEPVTQRDPEETATPTIDYGAAVVDTPSSSGFTSRTPVTITPPSVQPDSGFTGGAALDFGATSPTAGGSVIPIPDVTGAPGAATPTPAPVAATPEKPASATVYTRAPQPQAAAGTAGASRTVTAYRVIPQAVPVPQVYLAPSAPRMPTVVGRPSVQTAGQTGGRAASVQPAARPASSAAPAQASPAVAASGAATTAVNAVTTAADQVAQQGQSAARAVAPTPAAAPAPAAGGTADRAPASMVIYRRPAASNPASAAPTPAAGSVIYSRTSVAAQQGQASAAPQAQAGTQAQASSAPQVSAAGYKDGETISAILTGDVTTSLGGSMPVLARAMDGKVWIGAATIDGVRRMQILFDRYVDPVTGQVTPARAVAFSTNGKAGLDAKITTKAPNFVVDLLRAAVSGVDRYVTTLAGQKTVTVTAGGQTVQSSTAPNLGQTILANTSGIFKLPETGSTFIPVGELPAGTRLFVVVNVGTADQNAGSGPGLTIPGQ